MNQCATEATIHFLLLNQNIMKIIKKINFSKIDPCNPLYILNLSNLKKIFFVREK